MESASDHSWIDRFNEGELTEQEKSLFLKMIQDNPSLKTEVELDARLTRFLADTEVQELMYQIDMVSGRKGGLKIGRVLLWLLILALSLMVTLLVIWFLHRSNRAEESPVFNLEKTEIPSKNAKYQADASQLNGSPDNQSRISDRNQADFELLLGTTIRKSDFHLIAPSMPLIIKRGTPVKFSWHPASVPIPELLTILDESGEITKQVVLGDSTMCLFNTDSLSPGQYYWKLSSAGNMIMMGKFTCRQ